MDRKTFKQMLGAAKHLRAQLEDHIELILEESQKKCRCANEKERTEDPCAPCMARKETGSITTSSV